MRSTALVVFISTLLLAAVNPLADMDRDTVRQDVIRELESRWGTNYSAIETLLSGDLRAFDNLKALSVTETQAANLRDLLSRWYPDFSSIETLYNNDEEARRRLYGN